MKLKVTMHKTCTKCKVEQPLTDFHKGRTNGLKPQCKTCVKAYFKGWYEVPGNGECRRAEINERYATDIPYKLTRLVMNAARRLTGKKPRTKEALELLGCTLEEYIQYLESKFTEGMTWDNNTKEGWHIDHIEPLKENDTKLSKEEKLKRLHYTNTQPLWAKDNYSKGNKAQAVIEEK